MRTDSHEPRIPSPIPAMKLRNGDTDASVWSVELDDSALPSSLNVCVPATFIPGGGIETGFAAAPGTPVSTRAAQLKQQAQTGDAGDNRTYCGQAMSDLIQQAGRPADLTEGRPIVGSRC